MSDSPALLRRILPVELSNRAVADVPKLCNELELRLRAQEFAGDDVVTDTFRRLGGGG